MSADAEREALILRYFEGDVDPVEARRLERLRESDEALNARFWAVYEARTEALGLLAVQPGDPDFEGCLSLDTLEAHARGALAPEDAALVEAHQCEVCERQLEALRDAAPAAPAPSAPTDRGADVIPLASRWRVVGPALAVAAGAALFVLIPWAPEPDDFTPRGEVPAFEQLVGIEGQIRRPDGVEPLRDGAVLRPVDALSFRYANRYDAAPVHLSLFAVDEAGAVYWYYPAWTDPAANPRARPLPEAAQARLPEAVRHDPAPGLLKLVALFTEDAPTVRAVEAKLDGVSTSALTDDLLRRRFEGAAVKLWALRAAP